MLNQTRQFTDEQIIKVFKNTKRTAELEIASIEYKVNEFYNNNYIVTMTNGSKYFYEYTVKYSWNMNKPNQPGYHRIVKI